MVEGRCVNSSLFTFRMYRLCQFTKLVSETESRNIGDPLYKFCIAPFVRFFDTTIKSSFFQVRQKNHFDFIKRKLLREFNLSQFQVDLCLIKNMASRLTLRKFQSLVKTTLFFMHNRNEFDSPELETLQSN